jgi:methylase of polypeptide subunit release factors
VTQQETRPGEASQSLPFGELDIAFDDRVLRPREWTRAQSEWGAEVAASLASGPVLELCSGAGHIGLLTAVLSGRALVAVDVDPVACDFTRRNAAAAGLDVEVREGSMDEVLAPGETFPLVTADPPWVPHDDLRRFPEDPVLAIDGGEDGLDLARKCLTVIDRHLAPDGAALLQVGPDDQADRIGSWAAAHTALRVSATRRYERGVLVLLRRQP